MVELIADLGNHTIQVWVSHFASVSDIAQQAEAKQVLSSMFEFWDKLGTSDVFAMSNLQLTLAYLEFYLDNGTRVDTFQVIFLRDFCLMLCVTVGS